MTKQANHRNALTLGRKTVALAVSALLASACGRTDLEGWTGAAANSAGAPSSAPDFDFTPVLDQATAYQVHPSHSGSQQSVTITPPLARIWAQHFDAGVSYPIMAAARVFVSVNSVDASDGPVVEALAAASGAALWTSEPVRDDVGFTPVHLAYDRGLLFAANQSGNVLALEPVTGSVRWHARLPGVDAFGSLPLAAGGALFVGAALEDHYELFVLDERDGRLVYALRLATGGDPTLGSGKIFSTGTCDQTVAVDAATGSTVWHTDDQCPRGDSARTMLHDGVLWLPDVDGGLRLLDAASGRALGTVDDPSAFFLVSAAEDQIVLPAAGSAPALRMFGATQGAFRWQVALPALPVLPALTTPDTVYVVAGTSDKYLYGVDLVTRQFSWQSSEPAAAADDWNRTGAEPVQAMAASGGRIVVAYGRWLSAFAATN